MKLYIKQKVFSWGDKFRIYDELQNDRYYVKGEVLSLGKKLHLCDTNGSELSYIHEKVMSLMPKYYIDVNGRPEVEMTKKFTLLRPEYIVNGLGWTVSGNILAHDYSINANGKTVALVSKRWLSWGDTYEIYISDDVDEVMVMSIVLVIDAALESEDSACN